MEKKFSWLAVFLSVLLTQFAFAAEEELPPQQSSVYRCTEPDGSLTYTDSPCSGEGVHIGNKTPASTPSPLPQRPLAGSLPPECQRLQDEMDWRIEMLSMKSVAPTAPAYLIWLQQQIEACKRRQSGVVDAPKKDSGAKKRFPTGHIPESLDRSHLWNNPPRYLAPDNTKNERSSNKADNPPPSLYDPRSQNWLPPVRNQDPFGTCVAHAAIGSAESNAISQGFVGAKDIDLSEMYMAWFLFGDSRPGKFFLIQ